MARASLVDEIAAVRVLCWELGLGEVTPLVLKAAHHTSLRVQPLMIVARVQSAEALDMARQSAIRELAVTRFLASQGAPALAPLENKLAGPYVTASSIITLWPYVEQEETADEADAPLAATALVWVHKCMLNYDGELPPYTQTLDRCWNVLAHGPASIALAHDDRELLKAHYLRLRGEVEATASDWLPLHGDVHLGNLLLGRQGPVWTDFEDACLGPREIDIAGLPSTVWPCFADADQTLIRRYADLKSVCVATWCSADIARSTEVREAAEYHLQRVRGLAF